MLGLGVIDIAIINFFVNVYHVFSFLVFISHYNKALCLWKEETVLWLIEGNTSTLFFCKAKVSVG